MFKKAIFWILLLTPFWGWSAIHVGVSTCEMTPPLGTPSAGYMDRKGKGMKGVHDPLLATAVVIDNGEKRIAFCGVDHLGFSYDMSQEVIKLVRQDPLLAHCEVYIGSSHTHSGGGSYLNIPGIGEALAGPYQSEIETFYIKRTAQAIIQAGHCMQPAKLGIGEGAAQELSVYRGKWPLDVTPSPQVTVIKITRLDGSPLAVLFNYAMHPTVLSSENWLFSADFVGFAREHLQNLLGSQVQPIFFNGAQGDIVPKPSHEEKWTYCQAIGESLAKTVKEIWDHIETQPNASIHYAKESYCFQPQATPNGLKLPIMDYQTELNALLLNQHLFITIPGELSTVYAARFQDKAKELGFMHTSILGLVNDAHGYIILPESWRRATFESNLSFGGERYGQMVEEKVQGLIEELSKGN